MLDEIFTFSREFRIPNGNYTADGEPVREIRTLRTSQIADFRESDRTLFGTVNATSTVFTHPDDSAPALNSQVLALTVVSVKKCYDIDGVLQAYKLAMG